MFDALLKRLLPASLKERARMYLMRGNAVHCPICEQGAIAFLPSGTPLRAHALCPFCHSLERARALWLVLQQRDALHPGTNVLHVAPERSLGRRLRAMSGVRYTAGDKHEPGYTYGRDTIDLDITALPFEDNVFDLVICSHVLEHVQDDAKAMRELRRVMRPGALGALIVPVDPDRGRTYEDARIIDPQERLRAFGQFDHVRIYGQDYAQRLRNSGFAVENVDPGATLSSADRFRFGIRAGETLHFVTK